MTHRIVGNLGFILKFTVKQGPMDHACMLLIVYQHYFELFKQKICFFTIYSYTLIYHNVLIANDVKVMSKCMCMSGRPKKSVP